MWTAAVLATVAIAAPDLSACVGDPPCVDPRAVWFDHTAAGLGPGGQWVVYDLDEVTRPLRRRDLVAESELSLTVRLGFGEVGPDRLVRSRNGLTEVLGMAWTVRNRLDETAFDPEGRGSDPFPGCGSIGRFGTCCNPAQYRGLASARALDPTRVDEPLRVAAADVAVLAWWLYATGAVPDPTHGATNFNHRCGGTAYGAETERCDGWMGRDGRDDVRGARPTTGPLVFKAPGAWDRRGWYRLTETSWVDWDPWFDARHGHLVRLAPRTPDGASVAGLFHRLVAGIGAIGNRATHVRLASHR